MIEPEIAFCDITENMNVAEEFIKFLLTWALEKCAKTWRSSTPRIQPGLIETLKKSSRRTLSASHYTEAIEQRKERHGF